MSANGISSLATKKLKQLAKLDIAQAKRQGKTVAVDGTISGSVDPTKIYYRGGNVYDITSLPNPYDNTNSTNVDENPNTGGLIIGRPWLSTVSSSPETLQEALPGVVLVELESWYDGSDGEYFVPNHPSDGDTFTQWLDKSSFAHNANPIGGGTTRPNVQTNELNGLSVVRFDGVNDGLSINPYASLASLPGMTVFVVMKMTGTTGNPRIFSTNSGATEFYYDSTAGRFVVEAASGIGTSTVTNAAGFHIHTFAFDGSQTTNANSLKYRYDKTNITLSFTGTVGDTMSASNTTMYIGNNNGANYFAGDIAEFLIFTRVLTTTQIQNVENYLSNKWGL